MKKYQVVIFDLDDTLIDNLENVKYAFKMLCDKLGTAYSEDLFQKWYLFDKDFWVQYSKNRLDIPISKEDSNFVSYVQSMRYQMFFHIAIEEALKLNPLFLNALKENVIPVKNACKVLNYLNDDYVLVVATNGPREAARDKLAKINCFDFIKYIFNADMTKNCVTKPSKEFFQELFDYIDFHDKEHILIVGDSLYSDILGGINAGIDTCWFNKNEEELSVDYEPTYVINDLLELKRVL